MDCSRIPPEFLEEVTQPPVDEESFCQAFVASDEENIRHFFNEWGFVVVRDVLDQSQINACINEVWDSPNLKGVSREPAEQWLSHNWLQTFHSGYNARHGFLGSFATFSKEANHVRQLTLLRNVFGNLLGRYDLWAKFDRYGFMRPTKFTIDDERFEMDDWKTQSDFVHWDLNPFVEQQFCRVQGVLALTNHTATSGGFHCLPRFHRHLKEWADLNPERQNTTQCLVDFANKDVSDKNMCRVTMRAGSIVIWDSRLPHGNWPNDDDSFRMCLYLTYFPAPEGENQEEFEQNREARLFMIDPKTVLTEEGEKILGLKAYCKEERPQDEVSRKKLRLDSPFNRSQWGI